MSKIRSRCCIFQFTPARSRRPDSNLYERENRKISINSSAKPETKPFCCIASKSHISIHSSAKPETDVAEEAKKRQKISIHSSAKPETFFAFHSGSITRISIHSSAKPETTIPCHNRPCTGFQSTPARSRRRSGTFHAPHYFDFNPLQREAGDVLSILWTKR